MDSDCRLSPEQIAVLRAEAAIMVTILVTSLRSFGWFSRDFLAGYIQNAFDAFLEMESGNDSNVEVVAADYRALGAFAARSHWKPGDASRASRKAGCACVGGLMRVAKREGWPADTISRLNIRAIELFDRLSDEVDAGYAAELARSEQSPEELRRGFFDALGQQRSLSADQLAEMASRFDYTVPGLSTVVALELPAGAPAPDLGPDVRVGRREKITFIILPGEPADEEIGSLRERLGADRLAVGLPVSLNEAGRSMRLVRRALESDRPGPVIYCRDISRELQFHEDKSLAKAHVRLKLGPLAAATPEMQEKYMKLLAAIAETRCALVKAAGIAGIHRNTLRTWRPVLASLLGCDYCDRSNLPDLDYLMRCWRACGSPRPSGDDW
jgi:hypothetical protein